MSDTQNNTRYYKKLSFDHGREDGSRMRSGNAAENMNVLRHIGTNLLKQEKTCRMGIAGKRKKCGYDMDYLYKILRGLNTGVWYLYSALQ